MESFNVRPMFGAPAPVSFPARLTSVPIDQGSSTANNSVISDDPLYDFLWDSQGNFIWPILHLYTAVANKEHVITLLRLKVRILPFLLFRDTE